MLTHQVSKGTPTFEPVSLEEAKRHLALTANDFDDLITGQIKAARSMFEHDTGFVLGQTTCVETFDTWPAGNVLPLLVRPVQSVTSIAYIDTAGASQTLSSTLYALDAYRVHPVIQPTYGAVFPSLQGIHNAVTVTYVAGHAAITSVPYDAKQAVLLLVGHWFANRESVVTGITSTSLDLAYEAIVRRYLRSSYP